MKLQTLLLTAGVGNWDTKRGFNHTKIVNYCVYDGIEKDIEKVENLKCIAHQSDLVWARALRQIVAALEKKINQLLITLGEEKFDALFKKILTDEVESKGIVSNVNFSKELFTDDSFITSANYRNSKNHKLLIYHSYKHNEDKYICAVYVGEVLWVLATLARLLGVTIIITYAYKEDIKEAQDNIYAPNYEQITIDEYLSTGDEKEIYDTIMGAKQFLSSAIEKLDRLLK